MNKYIDEICLSVGGNLKLKTNVMYCLRQFNGIIRQLVQQRWTDFVRRLPKNKDILQGQQDTMHNFVIADKKCNGAKSNFLADIPFLIQWLDRNNKYDKEINSVSENIGIISNKISSENIAKWAYQKALNNRSPIWIPPKEFTTLNEHQIIKILL